MHRLSASYRGNTSEKISRVGLRMSDTLLKSLRGLDFPSVDHLSSHLRNAAMKIIGLLFGNLHTYTCTIDNKLR